MQTNAGKVVLGRQSLRILEMLARRSTDVVTRQEIRESLWPDGTIVEFEHSINVAIRRLRAAFGWFTNDGIETVRGRGYRLNVPVTSDPAIRSVAVLTFASEGPVMGFFSERLTESITNHLASLGRLRVVPRSSVIRFSQNEPDLQTLSRNIGAGSLVIGRVARTRGHVVACTELIDAPAASQVWGARFRRRERNMCLIRADLARAIFQGLCRHL